MELSHSVLGDDGLNTHYLEHYKAKEGPPHPCSVGVCMSIHSDLWGNRIQLKTKKKSNQPDFEMAGDDETICWEVVLMLLLPVSKAHPSQSEFNGVSIQSPALFIALSIRLKSSPFLHF